jgi:hypothetical protein
LAEEVHGRELAQAEHDDEDPVGWGELGLGARPGCRQGSLSRWRVVPVSSGFCGGSPLTVMRQYIEGQKRPARPSPRARRDLRRFRAPWRSVPGTRRGPPRRKPVPNRAASGAPPGETLAPFWRPTVQGERPHAVPHHRHADRRDSPYDSTQPQAELTFTHRQVREGSRGGRPLDGHRGTRRS